MNNSPIIEISFGSSTLWGEFLISTSPFLPLPSHPNTLKGTRGHTREWCSGYPVLRTAGSLLVYKF
jgi:hypothetical protein